jgi:hypothetical protein
MPLADAHGRKKDPWDAFSDFGALTPGQRP